MVVLTLFLTLLITLHRPLGFFFPLTLERPQNVPRRRNVINRFLSLLTLKGPESFPTIRQKSIRERLFSALMVPKESGIQVLMGQTFLVVKPPFDFEDVV